MKPTIRPDVENTLDFSGVQQAVIANAEEAGTVSLFTTDAKGLFEAYLDGFPIPEMRHHNCNTCRHFIEKYGGLVWVNHLGATQSLFWDIDGCPAGYQLSIASMRRIVVNSKITGVFYSENKVWGTPITPPWNHFYFNNDKIYKNPIKTAFQAMAEKTEEYGSLSRGLAEFDHALVSKALALLQSESLQNPEKFIGPVKWLKDLHEKRMGVIGRNKNNIVWAAVASAPVGFCHPRTTIVGSLLEDLKDSTLTFEDVRRRFEARTKSEIYQRPQAAPSEGNIKRAEEIVEKMGIKPALRRRYARLEEIPTIWKPKEEVAEGEGVFDHLKKKPADLKTAIRHPEPVTWRKFQERILPNAEKIQLRIDGERRYNLGAIATAVDFEAPPIIQWDNQDKRNPFSWYFYNHASLPGEWGLSSGWSEVVAITNFPSGWWDQVDRYPGAFFVIKGARDSKTPGLGLFPEILRSELHEIRSTIEAFSNSGTLEGKKEASVCGVGLQKDFRTGEATTLRVVTKELITIYVVDRWD